MMHAIRGEKKKRWNKGDEQQKGFLARIFKSKTLVNSVSVDPKETATAVIQELNKKQCVQCSKKNATFGITFTVNQ